LLLRLFQFNVHRLASRQAIAAITEWFQVEPFVGMHHELSGGEDSVLKLESVELISPRPGGMKGD
jgi:hypothetical protein